MYVLDLKKKGLQIVQFSFDVICPWIYLLVRMLNRTSKRMEEDDIHGYSGQHLKLIRKHPMSWNDAIVCLICIYATGNRNFLSSYVNSCLSLILSLKRETLMIIFLCQSFQIWCYILSSLASLQHISMQILQV